MLRRRGRPRAPRLSRGREEPCPQQPALQLQVGPVFQEQGGWCSDREDSIVANTKGVGGAVRLRVDQDTMVVDQRAS